MIKTLQTFAIFSAILISAVFVNAGQSEAQMPLPVYIDSSPMVAAANPFGCRRASFAPYGAVVPVQVNYPAYYAPQVPVVPMAVGPVPTMSAYYVPTVPVVQSYYAPVVRARRVRRFSVPVAPAAVYPVYWLPY